MRKFNAVFFIRHLCHVLGKAVNSVFLVRGLLHLLATIVLVLPWYCVGWFNILFGTAIFGHGFVVGFFILACCILLLVGIQR